MPYIDKEKFRMHIIMYQYNPLKVKLTDKEKEKFIRMLDEVPTADVVEVKHGKWISIPHKLARICSICSHDEPYKFADEETDIYNYCPYCGADMREEIEDERSD